MLLIASLVIPSKMFAQSCPENIGFENGNFQNWKAYTGTATVDGDKNIVETTEVKSAITGRQTIISDKSLRDPYGKFPIVPKNGGNFVVKLGNNGTGGQAEGISYLLTVPADRPEFTLTYQYAVVLEDPNHLHEEQPRFIARVKDVEKNEYISCASNEYISISNLPGFNKTNSTPAVIYKDWTPVTLNLSGYQGKQLIIEFISADCTLGGHFGYAYVDVNNLCGDLIIGNTYCNTAEQLTISGPSGFQNYEWYNENRTVKYGSGQNITIKPTPKEGSRIVLDLIPYTGFGCPSTITATIRSVDYQLLVKAKNTVCENSIIDLTSSEYILNQSPEFTYLVYTDKDLTQQITNPVKITERKTYYVKATNFKGCESVAMIDIEIYNMAAITVKNPNSVCYGQSVDISASELYVGDLSGMTRAYFSNATATAAVVNPQAIKQSGRYYVSIKNSSGCIKVFPIDVKINDKPALKINHPDAVCYPATVDLTSPAIFNGSDPAFTYQFYSDQALKIPVSDPKTISKSGTYYVVATNAQGCIVDDKINVVVDALPVLAIKNPESACYPERVDITRSSLYEGSSAEANFSYYYDEGLTNKIANPKAITKTGTYFVKASNAGGCYVSGKINVTVNDLPVIIIHKPKAIFDSEFIDLTAPEITNGSKGFIKTSYFEDASLTRPIANPTKINKAGIYYIAIENESGCSASASIELTILPKPKIIVPTAFTPQKDTNNRLYPFLVSIQKLTSFKVFNKWGILVYQTDAMASSGGWDGQFKSKMQPLETFSWFAEGIDAFGAKYQSTGKTILIL